MGGDTSGLLIVNADDWGLREDVTDAILGCFHSEGISSTTGMVFMADSVRAAQLATAESLPVGLHLNLTSRFTDESVSLLVRRNQESLIEHFESRSKRWIFNPGIRRAVAAAIADQLADFHRLYGHSPTHVDGHHHVHVSPNVVLSSALSRRIRMRPPQSFPSRRHSFPMRAFRGMASIAISRRFETPHRLFSLRDLHPTLGGVGLADALEMAKTSAVEIMVHPAREDEQNVLRSTEWRQLLKASNIGSYADLPLVT